MSSLGRLYQAERVKLRKSWPLLTAILAPLCQATFLAVLFWFSGDRLRLFKPGFRFWLELNYVAWNLVLMPIAAALLCDLSWDQEREAKAWTLLLIQPLPRYAHYLVKVLSHLSLLLIAQALFFLALLAGGFLLRLQPELLMGPLPLAILLRFAAYSVLASAAVAAFQTWLSMRIPGLWIALAVALVGSWLSLHWVGRSPMVQFLPWGLAGQMAIVFERWRILPWVYSLGSLGSALVLVALGAMDFVRNRETQA
jgi:hypothetical protein